MYHPDQVRPDGHDELAPGRQPGHRACLVAGCPCKDPRIVSHRRAAFFAVLALRTGETANRMITPEPGWTLPAPSYA